MRMLKRYTFLSQLILLFLPFFIQAQTTEDEYAIRHHLMVQLKGDAEMLLNHLPEDAYVKEWLSRTMRIVLLENPKRNFTEDEKNRLAQLPAVARVQYNHKVERRNFTPDDLSTLQWNLQNTGGAGSTLGADIKALEAWGLKHDVVSPYGDSIVLAIVEDPMDLFHSDINYFINYNEIDSNGIDDDGNGYIDDYRGWSPINNQPAYNDLSYDHGIHVSGIAAARTNNNNGIAGVGYGVKVLPIYGSTDIESVVVKAYDYAITMRKLYDATNGSKGAFVVASNSSFGIGQYGANPINSPIWCAMYDSMGKVGILSAVAGPNANVDIDVVHDVPSECPSKFVLAVTNTNRLDLRHGQAAYGVVGIDLGAPGTSIYSTKQSNTYGLLTGTSMATPHVCGAIGALYTVACKRLFDNYLSYPDSFALVFKQYLLNGTDRINSMNHYVSSNGRLNLYKAFLNVRAYNCDTCSFSYNVSRNQINCANSASGTVQINSSDNLTYLWSNGGTASSKTSLTSGIYSVTITDATNCSVEQSFFFDEPQPIKISGVNVVPITNGNPGNITVVANAGNDKLSYALDTGAYQAGYVFATTVAGSHIVHVKNEYGCVVDTIVTVGIDNAVDQLTALHAYVYPNPTSSVFYVLIPESTNESSFYRIVDMQGKTVLQNKMQAIQQAIDVSMLESGLYTLTLESENRKQFRAIVSVMR
ncbi:MAG: S8 family peptidase [Chitinophagales bacterium]|nr:S8 family peptidase [Chitinophagales bacterium]